MAIGTPTGIGSGSTTTTASPSLALGAAPSNTLVHFILGWGATAARTLNSVSGGGLSWVIDHQQPFAGAIPWGFAICSAQAPTGMSASTITATLSGGPFGTLMAGAYTTGLDSSASVKDVSDGGTSTVGAWDTTATSTTVPDTLVIGGCLADGLKTNTPSGLAATAAGGELYDFQYATEGWSMCVEYVILSSIQSASLTGTWDAGTTDKTAAFVAYKGAAVAAPVGNRLKRWM